MYMYDYFAMAENKLNNGFQDPNPTYSIDGDMQMVQKANAGQSICPPFHTNFLILPDDEVKEFVNSYDDSDMKVSFLNLGALPFVMA